MLLNVTMNKPNVVALVTGYNNFTVLCWKLCLAYFLVTNHIENRIKIACNRKSATKSRCQKPEISQAPSMLQKVFQSRYPPSFRMSTPSNWSPATIGSCCLSNIFRPAGGRWSFCNFNWMFVRRNHFNAFDFNFRRICNLIFVIAFAFVLYCCCCCCYFIAIRLLCTLTCHPRFSCNYSRASGLAYFHSSTWLTGKYK